MSAFEAALAIIVGDEGDYDNDPRDPGGETRWGHDQTSWPDVLQRMPPAVRAPMPAHVRDLTWAQAVTAYRVAYWDLVKCDQLPPPLALALFDATVNPGPGWAPRKFQEALGLKNLDGNIGPVETIPAAQKADPVHFLGEFTLLRLKYYRGLAQYNIYGHGWETRAIRTAALAMSYFPSAAKPAA